MKNILIIILIVASIGYMGVILLDKYKDIKETNAKIEQQKAKEVKPNK